MRTRKRVESPRRSASRPIVVGVGASAGALEAFKQFFSNMPAGSGVAFVLIQPLDPTHESLTAELIARCTAMPAVQVERDTAVASNHIYVIPPNRYLRIESGVLRLSTPPEPRGMRVPIDVFLRALAADQQERAIGIVLSGTGTDGTLGLKEIKASGGMAMVQDPKTAQDEGMPRSAIAMGGVDYVLPPEKMPLALLTYLRHSYVHGAVQPRPNEAQPGDDLKSIVALLGARAKFDFNAYKKATLVRRIQRRMGLAHVERMADYLRLLGSDPAEVTALFKDLRIGVTSFFREPKAWQVIEQDVLAPMIAGKAPGSSVRAWVTGCASGEEAYSMAMLLLEQLYATQKGCSIHLFASEVDRDALASARAGVYPEGIAADVPLNRLRRFFTAEEHRYRINKEVREVATFALHNLITDPPFHRLDLISCRNLLSYLEPALQKKIVALLHFALVEGGYLFLGSADATPQKDLFEVVSKKWRVYRRIGPTRHHDVLFPVVPAPGRRAEEVCVAPERDLGRFTGLAQQLLIERYAPASVVINRKHEILYFNGPTDDYLVQPAGTPTQDLLASAREALEPTLRGGVRTALREDRPVIIAGRVKRRDTFHRVKVMIEPLKAAKEMEGLLLVSFQDEPKEAATAVAASPSPPIPVRADDSLVRELEHELKMTREDLQNTIEELETSNEELKAANEEVMSVNDELQSTNEELETSREELQLLNEELSTVNNQLESQVNELEGARLYAESIVDTVPEPLLVLRDDLHVRSANRSFYKTFHTTPGETVDRPLYELANGRLGVPRLRLALSELLSANKGVDDFEVSCELPKLGPRTMRLNARAVAGTGTSRVAILLAMEDITERVRSEDARRATNEALRGDALFEGAPAGIAIVDAHGRILSVNTQMERLFGYDRDELIGKSVDTLVPARFRDAHTADRASYAADPRTRQMGRGRDLMALRKDGTEFPVEIGLGPVQTADGLLIAAHVSDISARKQAEAALQRAHEELERRVLVRTAELRATNERLADLSSRALRLQDEERRRIGRDLHDNTAQNLAGVAMNLALLQRSLKRLSTPARKALSESAALVDHCSQEIRTLSYLLHPPLLDEVGLASAVRWYVDGFAKRSGICVDVDVPPELGRLRQDIETALFRVVQECLTNVHRHANSSTVRVHISRTPDTITLKVEDQGRGLAAETLNAFADRGVGIGVGIMGMRERMRQLGGNLALKSGRGGTAVEATLPLAAPADPTQE